jgi:hypothetical protein
MSNRHPQYLTPNGFVRQKKRPTQLQERTQPESKIVKEDSKSEIVLSTSVAKRVIRKRKVVQRKQSENRSISPAAAKAIAEALKGMLHS